MTIFSTSFVCQAAELVVVSGIAKQNRSVVPGCAQKSSSKGGRRYVCSRRCGRSYSDGNNCRRHENTCGEVEVRFWCSGCLLNGDRLDNLRRHIGRCHKKNPKAQVVDFNKLSQAGRVAFLVWRQKQLEDTVRWQDAVINDSFASLPLLQDDDAQPLAAEVSAKEPTELDKELFAEVDLLFNCSLRAEPPDLTSAEHVREQLLHQS